MMPRALWTTVAAAIVAVGLAASAQAGPAKKAKEAVDPNCTAGKAVKGAAERATVGVGNRCKAGETMRDTLGVDGKGKNGKAPLKKRSKD
jgi:hypothetical protein